MWGSLLDLYLTGKYLKRLMIKPQADSELRQNRLVFLNPMKIEPFT